MKLVAKCPELVQKFVPRSRVGIFRNEGTRSTRLDPKLMFLLRFVLFGCIWDRLVALPNSVQKEAEQVQKFVPRSCVGIFRYECTRATPLDPKLIYLVRFVPFGYIRDRWLPYESRCEMGRTSAKVRATKSRRNFSQRTHPIHPIGP